MTSGGGGELELAVTAPALGPEDLHYLDRVQLEHRAARAGLDPQEREHAAQQELELERRIHRRP